MEESERPRNERRTDDWFLGRIVALANKEIELPLTLCVGGLLISGISISQRRYFEHVAEHIRSGSGFGRVREVLAESFATYPDQLSKTIAQRLRQSPEGEDPVEAKRLEEEVASMYIHLADVGTLSSSGEYINLAGAFWRGRIEAVDGFWIGTDE